MKFAKRMDWDKPTYNRATRIDVKKMLSFLTVGTKRDGGDWLGKDCGWTRIIGPEGLIITGAIIGGVEYLSSIEYGKNLHNTYNNYVNPFYLFPILNKDGRRFFMNMYEEEISLDLRESRRKAEEATRYADEMAAFWQKMAAL